MLMAAKTPKNQDGFITMIVMMLLILGAVVYFAYRNVTG